MVTLSYQGAGEYNVYFPDKMVKLTEAELLAVTESVLNEKSIDCEELVKEKYHEAIQDVQESIERLLTRLKSDTNKVFQDES